MSSIRTSFRKYPKLILSLAAAGSATTAAVITLSAAPAAHPATAHSAAAQPAAASVVAPAISRPMATLDSAAVSQTRAAQRTAGRMLARFGWGKRQWSPLKWLWNRESGWNKYATNPYSGAYGIPQAVPGNKMASAGNHWRTNATTQIRWGLRYIKGRYGRPRVAWDHELAYGWY
ncbi:MAG: lytic transglycosylase domain-containing protein [Streptosporangiaceae bacterium]